MLADLHTHSSFSFDGRPHATLDNMAKAAIAAGITHLAVTDHCDIDAEIVKLYATPDRDALLEAVLAAKKKWAGKLEILLGIELGEGSHCPRPSRELLARYPYDIVLGSTHNLLGHTDFCYTDFSRYDDDACDKLFSLVLSETMDVCDLPGIHVITHLTYMERYMFRQGRRLRYENHTDHLCALFARMIEKNLTLELNTSDLAMGFALPDAALLRLYRECGGTRVCLGSDAHEPEAIGRNFDAARALLAECGFTHLTVPTRGGDLTYPIA